MRSKGLLPSRAVKDLADPSGGKGTRGNKEAGLLPKWAAASVPWRHMLLGESEWKDNLPV